MSPSENDLRAALRRGEGDATQDVDVDRLVAAGRDRATQRRVRLLSGAAVVLVVAAAGTGGALIWGGSDSAQQTSGASAGKAAGSRAGGATQAAPATGAAAGACPAAAPARVAPRPGAANPGGLTPGAGGGTGQAAGAGGALFAKPVARLVVCAYPEGSSPAAQRPAGITLTGAQADTLRTSLEDAAKTRPTGACPLLVRADERQLAIVGVTADGTKLPVVTTTVNAVSCRVVVTNGTAVRYGWTPPASLGPLVAHLAPRIAVTPGGGGPAHGSPIHS
ncbi:hypothetical protein [uncultured Jatrophihabitans sp.]|uniref:hypothetical protein n=1 Tax=uncultured Jatrophihabitans sp. TaxID=1610747 RepID=UPI0035C986D5